MTFDVETLSAAVRAELEALQAEQRAAGGRRREAADARGAGSGERRDADKDYDLTVDAIEALFPGAAVPCHVADADLWMRYGAVFEDRHGACGVRPSPCTRAQAKAWLDAEAAFDAAVAAPRAA